MLRSAESAQPVVSEALFQLCRVFVVMPGFQLLWRERLNVTCLKINLNICFSYYKVTCVHVAVKIMHILCASFSPDISHSAIR